MRLIVATLAIIVFFSCGNPSENDDKSAPGISHLQSTPDPDSIGSITKESTVDSNIYQTYLPDRLIRWLNHELPGWSLPSPSRWDNYWFSQYKKDSSLVNYLSADFNCDGKNDYAAIISEEGNIAVCAFMATQTGFKEEDLETYDKDNGQPIDIGLELLNPGYYEHLDRDKQPLPAKIKCPSIELIYFEKAAVTYYWDNGKFRSVQTGD